MRLLYVTLLLGSLLSSCNLVEDNRGWGTDRPPEEIQGLRPVYASGDWTAITVLPPQPIEELGKIYYKDDILFVNEKYKGVHVIDNKNPEQPTFLKFIQIPGNRDIAIKGSILYADNVKDLVAINLSDLDNLQVTSRVKDVYSAEDFLDYPENYWGYFECVDPAKGIVLAWENAMLQNPECWR